MALASNFSDHFNETIETMQTSARIIRNEADYYEDYAQLNNFNYEHVFATSILDEFYHLNFAMRKVSHKGWKKLLDIFELNIWLWILISLVILIIFGAFDHHMKNLRNKTRKSWFESIMHSFSFYFAKLLANNTGKSFNNVNVYIFSSILIASE